MVDKRPSWVVTLKIFDGKYWREERTVTVRASSPSVAAHYRFKSWRSSEGKGQRVRGLQFLVVRP